MTSVKAAAAAALILIVSACGPKAAEQIAASAAPGCAAEASKPWAAGKATLTITGAFNAAECAKGDAVLTVKDASGKQLYTFSLPVEVAANTVFAEAKTSETMKAALGEWIDPAGNTTMQTTSALPEWAAKDAEPGNAEFPFMPDVSREAYAKLRTENKPLYCHVQGGESQACLAYDETANTLSQVGLQRFPG